MGPLFCRNEMCIRDRLCNQYEYTTVKQAQSIVRQMDKNGMLSELYGVIGWDGDFRKHKLQGDLQAAMGVTLRVPHLAWCSMRGDRKRDYPQSIFYQSAWYREYPMIENHFARVNSVSYTHLDVYKRQEKEMAKGHEVTLSIPVQGGKTVLSNDIYLKAECNGKVCYVRASNLTVTNWGFTLGNGPDDMTIRSITMVAGCDVDQNLIWPAGAGEQVLNVPQTAIRPNGTVTIGGEIPTAPEMSFDSKDTEYVDGTVLHLSLIHI